jgi:hypothetical protein
VSNAISYTRNSALKGKNTGNFETSHPVGKYRLKCLTNSIMLSHGKSKDYKSQIVSKQTQN